MAARTPMFAGLVEIGRVWKTRDRGGNPTLTGYTRPDIHLGIPPNRRLLIKQNRDRKSPDDCDFIVYYALGGKSFDPRKP